MKALWSWLLRLFGHKTHAPLPVPPVAPIPVPAPALPVPAPVPPPVAPTPIQPVVVVTPEPTPSPSSPPSPIPAPPVVPVPGVPPTVPPPVAAPVPPPVNDPVVHPGSPGSNPVQPQPSPVQPPPTFTDDFSAGHLDTSKWIPSTWGAPGSIPGVHQGQFSRDALDFSHGCLRIKVSQTLTGSGEVTSIGGELQSRQTFGFGTYEWVIRASSTSETPQGSGRPVSGQISSGFIFQQDRGYTEIDSPEIEGDKPDQLSWTTWTDDKTREYTAAFGAPFPEASFHSYKCVWLHDSISFYVDGVPVAHHSVHIPQNPAYAMINHWGTNSRGWGGMATPGVDRYMFVKKFSFTPA